MAAARGGDRWERQDELSGGFKDREEARIVKKKAISGAIEESTVKAEAGDAALQFRRGRRGCLQGKRRKPAESGRMGAHCLGEFVIDVAGQRTRRIRIERIEAHCSEREHLEIDPSIVHVGDSTGTDVEEFGMQFRKLRRSPLAISTGSSEEGFRNEVFFKRDGAHGVLDDAARREFHSCGMRMAELKADLSQSSSPHVK